MTSANHILDLSEFKWLLINKSASISPSGWNLVLDHPQALLYVKDTRNNSADSGLEEIKRLRIKITTQLIETGKLIENDFFGTSKFFFIPQKMEGLLAASNDFWTLVSLFPGKINHKSLYDYTLFNYFRKGQTFIGEIHFSSPGSSIHLETEKVSLRFKPSAESVTKSIQQAISVDNLADSWSKQLSEIVVPSSNYGITLTGGYDSRMILAGLSNQNIQLTALTFGQPDSDDAQIASLLADHCGLPHRIDSPGESFYENFENHAMEAVRLSGGLLNPLRMVRLSVFEQWTGYDGIFFGYAGSELLRGLYFDSLLSSRLFYRFNTGSFNRQELKQLIHESLQEYFMIPKESIVDSLADEYLQHPEYQEPFPHLMNTIIPMHFGEDLRYLSMKGIRGIAPFLHPGFYNTLLQNNCIGLLKQKKAFQKLPSMDSPLVSASIITKLDRQLAGIPLTKGFSPRDYAFSKYYAGIKWMWKNKLVKTKKQPVTILWPWYKKFLLDFIHRENSVFFDYDKKSMLAALEKHTGNSEASYLPYTRFLHLRLMEKALKNFTKNEF